MDKWVKISTIVLAAVVSLYVMSSVVMWSFTISTAVSNLHNRLINIEKILTPMAPLKEKK